MEALKTFLDTPAGGVAALVAGALVVLIIYAIHRRIIADRAYAGQVATVEANLGFSTTWTQPLTAFSNGDNLGAMKAFKAKFDHYKDPQALATELVSVFQKQYSTNPKFAADVDAFLSDVKSGNAPGVVTDVKAMGTDLGLDKLGPPPAILAFNHLKEKIDAIKANPALAGLLAHVPDANGILAGVVSAAHDVGSASVVAASPVAAPVVAAVDAATGVTVTGLQAGHTVNVTATPGTPAAAVPAS